MTHRVWLVSKRGAQLGCVDLTTLPHEVLVPVTSFKLPARMSNDAVALSVDTREYHRFRRSDYDDRTYVQVKTQRDKTGAGE